MAKKKPVEEEDEDVDEEEKEEANRLKTLAEEKYKLSNFKSALKYSKRAQRLHPNLQGISDMVTAFNILDIASKSSSDDDDGSLPDWYKILEVEPFSHINSIKKQYKKLALILHPDKNTCIASEEAFKHVGEAFRVLSDKIKRKDYDLKFRIALQSQVTVSSDVTPVSRVVDTFWTKCSTCRLFHQFERRYMGQSLMCPSCKKSFLAVEAVVDDDKTRVKGKGSGGGSSLSEKNDRKESVGGSENITRKREASDSISDFFDRMGLRSPSNKKAKKIPEMTLAEMQLEETKKRPEKTLAEMQLEETKKRPEKTLAEMQSEAKRKVQSEKGKMKEVAEKAEKIKGEQNKTEEKRTNKEREKVKEKEKEKVKVNEKKGKTIEKEKVKEKVNEKEKVIVNEKKGKVNKKEKEMEKVKEKVMAKEKEKEKVKEKEKEKEKVSENEKGKASEKEKEKEKASMKEKAKEKAKEKEKEKEKEKKEKANEKAKEKEDRHLVTDSGKNRNLEVMAVEDSDFYNFDKDRMERSFKKGQVWAVYDDDDGMPRHYGLIDEVVSANPFEVKMSWLDLQNNTDEGLISWHRSVSISCGRFKVAKKTTIDSVNFFSHPVECERVAREVYRIYPKKGSIWALYRERDLDENEAEPISGDNRFYDIVVFLTSYSEMHGLSMAYLEKVEGFKTIFTRREIGCHAIRWFEKDNVQLFSHQIPARKLLGKEAPGLPKDSWELDPASLSPDLLIMSGE